MSFRLTRALVLTVIVASELAIPCTEIPLVGSSVAEARRRTARARRRLARQLYIMALDLKARGACKRAIVLFQRSFRLSPRTPVLVPLGQCYLETSQPDKAKKIFVRLLGSQSQGLNSAQITQLLAQAEKRLRAPDQDAGTPTKPPDKGAAKPPKPDKPEKPDTGSGGDAVAGADTGEETIEQIGEETIEQIGEVDGAGGGSGDVGVEEITGTISGYARTSLDVDLAHDRAPGPTDIPEDSLELRNSLLLRLVLRYGSNLQASTSVLFDHVLRERPPGGDETFWLFNGSDVRSDFDADVVESFINVSLGRFDVRAGMLRVTWGKSDYVSPNDVVNPRDLRNPLRETIEVLRLPVLAAEVTINLEPLTLSLVWQPLFRADRMMLYGTDSSIMAPALPAPIRGLGRFISGLHDDALTEQMNDLLMQTELPPEDPRASSFGLRAAVQIKGVDVGAYYHYGWDTSPRLQVNPTVMQALDQIDWSRVKLSDFAPLLQLTDQGVALYRSNYIRRHHAGLEAGTTFGSFVLRGEVGYDSRRVFYDGQVRAHVRGAVAANLGVEYQISLTKVLLLEASYLGILDAPGGLLFYDAHSVGIGAGVRWSFLNGDLEGEVRALFNLTPWTVIVRPQLSYKITKRWSCFAGVLVLEGEDLSMGGYFNRNDLVFVGATFSI